LEEFLELESSKERSRPLKNI